MKKFMIASAIAMMCLSANAFAEDDGYGNDIPPARSEGTVDDGYGNKLPANNEPEYKTFEEARASSYGSTSNSGSSNNQRTRLGVHFGAGFAFLANYPTDKDFVEQYGDNEWLGVSMDIGLILKFPLNPILSFVPEVNFGIAYLAEEIKGAGGNDYYWGEYKVDEAKTLYNINIPLMLRLQAPFVYLEGGARLSFNISTDHEYEYKYPDGTKIKYIDKNGEEKTLKRDAEDEWKVKTFIPSVVAGIGTTFLASGLQCDLGLRFIWDLRGVEEKDKEVYAFEVDNKNYYVAKLVENESSLFSIQLVFNVFF